MCWQRAFGRVKQVVKLFKPSFVDPTFFGSEAIWQQIGEEPQLLLGRNEDNNSLIHLFITHFVRTCHFLVRIAELHHHH